RALRNNRAWPYLRSSPGSPAVCPRQVGADCRRKRPSVSRSISLVRNDARRAGRSDNRFPSRSPSISVPGRTFVLPRRASRPLLLVVVLHFLELGVDDVVVAARLLALGSGTRRLLAVDLLHEAGRDLVQRANLRLDAGLAVALQRLLELRKGALDLRPLLRRHLVAAIRARLLGRVHQRTALVLDVHELSEPLVLGRVRLGVLDHALDLLLAEARRR